MNSPADTQSPENEPAQGRSLGLRVPDQSPPPVDSILLDPRETAAWFDSLPMANIGETARQVFSTLVDFNRYQIPELIRAKTVEQFRAPVGYISENLRRHYLDLGVPLSAKSWKTATLARELNAELAISYKVIVERMLTGESNRFDRKLLVIALHRALDYVGNVLLQSTLVYADSPPFAWREINAIYAYAYQNRIHRVPVRSGNGRKDPATTIEDRFKALLLYWAAVPYRLRPSNNLRLYSHLLEWGAYCNFVGEDDEVSDVGQYNIDLWSDEPPVHNGLRPPPSGRRHLIFDLRKLLKKLRADFEQAPWEGGSDLQSHSPAVTRPLLRQLITTWQRPPDRRFVRTRLNFELHVVVGLNTVHGNLLRAAQPVLEAEDDEPTSFADQQLVPSTLAWSDNPLGGLSLAMGDSDFAADSHFNDSYLTPSTAGNSLESDSVFDWMTPEHEKAPVQEDKSKPYRVKTHNENAGGYCIAWSGDQVPKIKVGELVGIESASHRNQYGLGVVRWLRQQANHQAEVGLQVLSTHCEAAEVRPRDARGANRNNGVKCLLLPAVTAGPNSTAASLVMSNISFAIGSDLVLFQGGEERSIRLTRLLDFNSAFAQFQFSYVTQGRLDTNSEMKDDTNFEDLWGSL